LPPKAGQKSRPRRMDQSRETHHPARPLHPLPEYDRQHDQGALTGSAKSAGKEAG
jgi:hypothetical protein